MQTLGDPVAVGPRQTITTIPLADLLDLISGRRIAVNLPEGAKIISAWFDGFELAGAEPSRRLLRLRIESDALPETEVGMKLPMMKLRAPWRTKAPRK
jgi:hypothetical protein